MTDILGIITARGGSKGIPGKNIRSLGGKPLIAWSIQAALESHIINRLIVSTDDMEIAKTAQEWGAEVPFMRPAELAQDTSPHILAIEHALRWLESQERYCPDYVLTLQPTSPFRTADDITCAVNLAISRNANAVIGVTEAQTHPYLAKKLQADGTIVSFMTTDLAYLRHQDFPPAYVINGAIYVNRRESLLSERTFFPQGSLAYIMPQERSLDIDTMWDFHLAELILEGGSGK